MGATFGLWPAAKRPPKPATRRQLAGDFFAAERVKWGKLITDLGLKVRGN
jgi:hypothetical protein